jgi:predicted acylesterase/phospholipase RssA
MADHADTEAVRRAKDVVKGGAIDIDAAFELVRKLKREDAFRWGRQVLTKVSTAAIPNAQRRKLMQELALCTYKDSDRPALGALDEALETLAQGDDLNTTTDQETLGPAGAIYKRKWQVTGQRQYLETAYRYYRRGHDGKWLNDKPGYTSINAAFILDLLASIEQREVKPGAAIAAAIRDPASPTAAAHRREAREIRAQLVEQLAALLEDPARKDELAADWWFLVTIAEAFFGLGDYGKAEHWLQRARALPNRPDWELRSTAFQLAALYELQQPEITAPPGPHVEAVKVLDAFVGSATARTSAFVGKIGLALSGGGFRASLFHIGVLARLAELDLLRHVEVLSCVSGGSIIGAFYYLHLRRLLQTTDVETLDDDEVCTAYVDLVARVATDFLGAVQTNIRMRVFGNPLTAVKALWDESYSHTRRLGSLLESRLYRPICADVGGKSVPIPMQKLKITPKNCDNFDPKKENWRRKAKAPVLVLNATTLNTAHNWQYTASFMGESPYATHPTVDGTNRLRRMYYEQAPPRHKQTSLGQAVVASACVPGLFEPLRLDGLYQHEELGMPGEPFVIRQVDGGVHDNQGIASLFEQDCSVILVSDASGQINTTTDPGGGGVAPLSRSNSVLMQRVRQEQFARLKTAFDGGLIRGMMFIHLKQDLDVEPVSWLGCEEPAEQANPLAAAQTLTSYLVRKRVQKLVAGIRTDLDSFSEVEAFALMTSGYRMAERFLPAVAVLPKRPPASAEWPFLAIEKVARELATTDPRYLRFELLLRTGSVLLFRAFQQSRLLWLCRAIAGIALFALALWLWFAFLPPTISVSASSWWVFGFLAAIVIGVVAFAYQCARGLARRMGWLVIGFFVWIPVWLHLWTVDRIFLEMGKLKRVVPPDDPRKAPASPMLNVYLRRHRRRS